MIKKLCIVLVIVALLSFATSAYAGVTGGAKKVFDSLIVNDTDRHWSNGNDESTAAGEFYIGDKTKVAFHLITDNYARGTPTSIQVEVEVNVAAASDATWSIMDIVQDGDGSDDPTAAIVHTSGAQKESVFYLPASFTSQYVSVEVIGTGTDATNTFDVDLWVTWQTER